MTQPLLADLDVTPATSNYLLFSLKEFFFSGDLKNQTMARNSEARFLPMLPESVFSLLSSSHLPSH